MFHICKFANYGNQTKIIRNKQKGINPNDIEVINVALVVFSIICDAHANEELERHAIIEDMLDTKTDFIYYVNDLIKQTSDTPRFKRIY